MTRGTRPISSGVHARIKNSGGAMTVAETTSEMAEALNKRAKELVGQQLGPPWTGPSWAMELRQFLRAYKPLIFTVYVIALCCCLCSGFGHIFASEKSIGERLLEELGLPIFLFDLSSPHLATWAAFVLLIWVMAATFDLSEWTPTVFRQSKEINLGEFF
jgi:hypothetical protein